NGRIHRKHKQSLCLLWFTHNIFLPKDPGNNILLKYVNFCQYIEAFKNYLWSHESFHLTVDYMLMPLGEKTSNLFGFPWAFMAYVATFCHMLLQMNSYVATCDTNVATCDTNVATYESSVATCATNVATDDLSFATCTTNVATDESCVAICDTCFYI
ncbi:hypothetical protein EJD97_014716, partial [Solanum chilense]